MRHLRLFRAMLGGAGLVGCIGLLAGQARADIVEFVPVRSAYQPVALPAKAAPASPSVVPAKALPRPADAERAKCRTDQLAMAPSRTRGPH